MRTAPAVRRDRPLLAAVLQTLEARRLLAAVLLEDINPATQSAIDTVSAPILSIGDTTFFAADDGANGRELWKTDGTPAGTVLVKDIQPGHGSSGPSDFVEIDGRLFFLADDGVHGAELWLSQGIEAAGLFQKEDRQDPTGQKEPPGHASPLLIHAVFAGADEQESEKDDGQFEGMGPAGAELVHGGRGG